MLEDDPPPQPGAASATSRAPRPTIASANAGRRLRARSPTPSDASPAPMARIIVNQNINGSTWPRGGAGRVRPPGALLDPVVEIVSVEVIALEPFGVTEPGEKLHTAPVGGEPHESDTAALNPPCGDTLMV